MKLSGSVVLITGGTLGIGKATAKLLISKGAKVIVTGRNKERLDATAKELQTFSSTRRFQAILLTLLRQPDLEGLRAEQCTPRQSLHFVE